MDRILVTGDFDIPARYMSERIVHLRAPRDDQDVIDHLTGVSQYVIGGPEYLHERIMAAAPDLRHVVLMGTGTSSFVDIAAAQARGIELENTPGINADAVAEFALGMLIVQLADGFHSRHDLLEGGWYQKPHKTLSEAAIGIVGLGNIGGKLAARIKAVSAARVAYHSRTRKPDLERELGIAYKSLADLSRDSDALALCATYTPQTHHLIDAETLQGMKKGAILLNFGNPRLVDPLALKSGLDLGRPRLAYIDGYYNEWASNQGRERDDLGLLGLGPEKFVATSHIAALSRGVIAELLDQAFSKIELWRAGQGN